MLHLQNYIANHAVDIPVNVFSSDSHYCALMSSAEQYHLQQKHQKPEQVISHTSNLLREISNAPDVYHMQILGHDILVHRGVFRPTTETTLLTKHIQTRPGERFLDMTTGSGVAAVVAGKMGATGVAVDINPRAVANAEENFHYHGVGVRAIQSNMFGRVPKEEFDLILCNPPYYEGVPREPIEYAIFGGRAFLDSFFRDMKPFMKPHGRALLTYAQWAGDTDFLEQTMEKYNYTFRVVAQQTSSDGKRVYDLYEARK